MRHLVVVAILGLAAGSAMAAWYDNFDSYTLGSINGQGGWTGWDNTPAYAGVVSNEIARSSPNSQLIAGTADSVQQYTGYNSGTYEYVAWQYVPGNMTGNSYFIMLSKYVPGSSASNVWCVQLDFNGATKQIVGDCGGNDNVTLPYISDQWVEIKVKYYLDPAPAGDWVQIYYNGTLLDDPALPNHATLGGGYKLTGGVFGNQSPAGPLDIAAVDLFANNATKVFYDDMSLDVPEPASFLLLAVLGLLRRR